MLADFNFKKFSQDLAAEVEIIVQEVKAINETARTEIGLPGPLQEKLSAANSLLTTLPVGLAERSQYLDHNKVVREAYHDLKVKLDAWISEAETRIDSADKGVDFENIFSKLEDHKVVKHKTIYFVFILLFSSRHSLAVRLPPWKWYPSCSTLETMSTHH